MANSSGVAPSDSRVISPCSLRPPRDSSPNRWRNGTGSIDGKIVAVNPPIDTKKVSRSIVFEETFGVPREGHEKSENPEILGAAAVVSRNNGASLDSNHAITDINTTNDAHDDALLYISGYLWRDGVKVEQLSVKIFCDGGSSADIIKSRVLSDWEEKLGVKFPRVMGKPLALEMANSLFLKLDLIELC